MFILLQKINKCGFQVKSCIYRSEATTFSRLDLKQHSRFFYNVHPFMFHTSFFYAGSEGRGSEPILETTGARE